ncbi:heavy metal-binding domain-containing protein [Magnetospira thiophila]
MILTTTTADTVEGRQVTQVLGIVAGHAVMGTNFFKDLFAGVRDFIGGRSGSYEKELRKAKELALEDLVEEAKEMGADAVIGIDLDYDTIGGDEKTLLMVSANGTAVKLG